MKIKTISTCSKICSILIILIHWDLIITKNFDGSLLSIYLLLTYQTIIWHPLCAKYHPKFWGPKYKFKVRDSPVLNVFYWNKILSAETYLLKWELIPLAWSLSLTEQGINWLLSSKVEYSPLNYSLLHQPLDSTSPSIFSNLP